MKQVLDETMLIVRNMGSEEWANREEQHLSCSPDYLMEIGCSLSVLPEMYASAEDLQDHVTPLQLLFE